MAAEPRSAAREFAGLFPRVYLAFHRRDEKRELPNASRAVLQHLALTGPLTIGEMAQHLSRAQSVVSEIVDHLERDGLLERMRDARDRRRVLVWLSQSGQAEQERANEVLSSELLEHAMQHMTPASREALLSGMQALLDANQQHPPTLKKKGKSR
ncbi:MAG TPA: MarR family winged helix-turn-helix transcriptional regulator [Polyangiaceae bacterium]|nr:MarR family winged helix-turn-helix transcriptional regulator [Polyangiaceae bacterium]